MSLNRAPAPPRSAGAGRSWERFALSLLSRREAGVGIALALIVVGFSLAKHEFLSPTTLGDILTMAAELGVAATGVTFLMISGEFDLSVGSTFALVAMTMAALMTKLEWNGWVALAVALALGAAIGLVNGVVTVKTGIPSFIATLGAMMFWRGIALFTTQGWPISVLGYSPVLSALGGARIRGTAHVSAVWWLALVAVFWVTLTQTRFGNWVFATGGKREAARALGVPVLRVKLINFSLAGLLAGLAGCLQFGRMGSMSPIWGDALGLEAIAAAVIGGTALAGGTGTILGTLLGAVMMCAIRSGLVMVGAPAYWYMSFIGVIIVAAVVLNMKIGEAVTWRR